MAFVVVAIAVVATGTNGIRAVKEIRSPPTVIRIYRTIIFYLTSVEILNLKRSHVSETVSMIRLLINLKKHFKSVDAILIATKKVLKNIEWDHPYIVYLETFRIFLKQYLDVPTSPNTSPTTTRNNQTQTDFANSYKLFNSKEVKVLSSMILPPHPPPKINKRMPFWKQRKNQVNRNQLTTAIKQSAINYEASTLKASQYQNLNQTMTGNQIEEAMISVDEVDHPEMIDAAKISYYR